MALKDNIHSLISTMSRAEKRYFKVNASKNGDASSKQFIKLFDAIDKGQNLPLGKGENRSVTNTYLYGSILECLTSYQEKNSITAQLDRYIRQAAMLSSRGLGQQSFDLFLKAEAIAQQQQDFTRLQLIYWHVRSSLASKLKPKEAHITMDYVLEQNLRAAQENELLARLRFVQHHFQQTVLEATNLTEETISELDRLVNSQTIQDVKSDSGFFSQLTANHIWSQYYAITKNNEMGLLMGRKVFDLCYNHRELLSERGRLLIASANNYMMRCMRAEEFSEMKRVLELLENEKPKDSATELVLQETYLSNLLIYHILTGTKEPTPILQLVETRLESFSEKMNQTFLMYIFTLCSTFAFYCKDYRKALRWINRFLNHDKRVLFPKNLEIARDYRLLIYYEQNKLDLLEKSLTSEELPDAEVKFPLMREAIRSFLRKELNAGENHSANLKELEADFSQLKDQSQEMEAFEFFRFDEWIASKL